MMSPRVLRWIAARTACLCGLAAGLSVGAALAQTPRDPAARSVDAVEVLDVIEVAQAQPLPKIEEVTHHLDDLYRANSSQGQIEMQISTEHWSRTLQMEVWSKGEDWTLLVIRSPAKEAGTATLRNPDGLWNYAPRADRLMRIPEGMLSDSWMGSHFTNDDLVRESSWEDDYTTEVAWDEVDGAQTLRLTSAPKPDAPVVYGKVEQWLLADGWLPLKAVFYDDDGLPVRTMLYSDIRELGGRRVPTVMTIIPNDKPKERTQVTYQSMRFNASIDDSIFTARGLRKAAQR
jgi:outer membrane lipoprotein-sorting protein